MKNSSIEWTHHTFNPWWGCQRVSPGCQHCYAETLSKRWGHQVWGPAKTTSRRMMSENYWQQPFKWDKAAAAAGERHRVFCSSMADVFEDHPEVEDARAELWQLIEITPALDWLLLTKRPENIARLVPQAWLEQPRPNVWYGTSVEDQQRADERIPVLLDVPAAVRFLSCEPLLGPVDLSRWLICERCNGDGQIFQARATGRKSFIGRHIPCPACQGRIWRHDLHWVIAGGESGAGARPMNPDWARRLRDDCNNAGVAFHFKQWGEYRYGDKRAQLALDGSITFHNDGMPLYVRAGKKEAGRTLDGRTWDEVPQ